MTVVASCVVLLALNGYEIGLLTVALVFIAFALIVALAIPQVRPDFPANRIAVFVGICVALFLVQMGAVFALAEFGEDEEAVGEVVETLVTDTTLIETTPTETLPTETTLTETETVETLPTDTTLTETEPGAEGDPVAGREVFLTEPCGSCHTLADAGTTGSVGPNLDSSPPPYELVVDRVTNGRAAMPSFAGRLSDEQIADVAAYVSSAAGS